MLQRDELLFDILEFRSLYLHLPPNKLQIISVFLVNMESVEHILHITDDCNGVLIEMADQHVCKIWSCELMVIQGCAILLSSQKKPCSYLAS